MADDELRRFKRKVRVCLWASVALNIAIPFLLWSMLGSPPPGFGIGNFGAAGMAAFVAWWTRKIERERGDG